MELLATWVWATGLWLIDRNEPPPIVRIAAWAGKQSTPRTPSGFVWLFHADELFFAPALAFGLLLSISLIAYWWSGGRSFCPSLPPAGTLRAVSMRIRLRTALVAIGNLGVYLGWEVSAWRSWRLRDGYIQRAIAAAGQESAFELLTQQKLVELHRLSETDPSRLVDLHWPSAGFYRSRAGRVDAWTAERERLLREIHHLTARAAAWDERRRKYELASADPWRSVEPDAPMPGPSLDADEFLRERDYAHALAAYDELARRFPDLVEAHCASAWIRATCPDARYRDSKLAIAAATRACELTKWQDHGSMEVLAAALAEAGDFERAVEWQQKVVALNTSYAKNQICRDRLGLYLSEKPCRHEGTLGDPLSDDRRRSGMTDYR